MGSSGICFPKPLNVKNRVVRVVSTLELLNTTGIRVLPLVRFYGCSRVVNDRFYKK